jgi:hypothetical protein
MALPFTIKKYLKAKGRIMKYFNMKKHNLESKKPKSFKIL